MLLRPSRWLAATTLVALVAGCDVNVQEQELRLLHDAEGDRFELLIVNYGLESPVPEEGGEGLFQRNPEQALETALKAVADFAEGRRRFLFTPLIDLDVDEILAEDEPDSVPEPGSIEARGLAAAADIEVLSAGAFVDEEERLGTWQRFRVPHAAELVALTNASVDRALLRSDATTELVEWGLDPATARRFVERAQSGSGWLALEQGVVVVDLPLTEDELDGLRKKAFRAAAKQDLEEGSPGYFQLLGHLIGHLDRVEVSAQRCRLRFEPGPDGDFALHVGWSAPTDDHLRDAWIARGDPLAEPDLIELRGSLQSE